MREKQPGTRVAAKESSTFRSGERAVVSLTGQTEQMGFISTLTLSNVVYQWCFRTLSFL